MFKVELILQFKGFVIGSYMETELSFGQTAGQAVANTIMSTPKVAAEYLQKLRE